MSEYAVRAEQLGKKYFIGERLRYRTIRDSVADAVASAWQLTRIRDRGGSPSSNGVERASKQHIWALRNVTFDVKVGEVVGLIGPNGAGKSTLLKVLSRITEPTEGRAEIQGRIGSLLEVGTGFHPELTGRENIFLNGAILGMKRSEISQKFDEIVEFSGIERFIETPVKRYSSGMYTRLAFAVAAHLEPEILLVDEVLAVGDAEFQKKCLGKMSDVARDGRTVLFVSHNLLAVQSLCHRALWIGEGKVVDQGKPGEVISRYLRTAFLVTSERTWPDLESAPGTDRVRLRRARVRPLDPSSGSSLTVRTSFVIEFEYAILQPDTHVYVNLYIYNEQGILVFNTGPVYENRPSDVGQYRESCYVPGDLLNDGMHRVVLEFVVDRWRLVREDEMLLFEIQDSDDIRGAWFGKWPGAVRPILAWETERVGHALPHALSND